MLVSVKMSISLLQQLRRISLLVSASMYIGVKLMQCMLIDRFFKGHKPKFSGIIAYEAINHSNGQIIPDYSKEICFYGANADLEWALEHYLDKGLPIKMDAFETESMPEPYSDQDLLICINPDKRDMLISVLDQAQAE